MKNCISRTEERSLRYFPNKIFLILLLFGFISPAWGQTSDVDNDFLKASVLQAEVGMDQFDRGFIYAGIKYLKWDDIRFRSSNFYYEYSPWQKLHSLRLQFDYTLYFPSVGVSFQGVTDGDRINASIRPQLGIFFIYANVYLGYNIWVNQQFRNGLNNFVLNAAISIPYKRW